MSMTTRELAEQLRRMVEIMRDDLGMPLAASDIGEAAARLEELDAEGWRSVEEGMPPVGDGCSVCGTLRNVYCNVFWDGAKWRDKDGNTYRVTHWRPRPAPPKPGQSGGGE